MPQVPNVAGQPVRKTITQPPIEEDDKAQAVPKVAKIAENQAILVPPPASPAPTQLPPPSTPTPPSQDELAALSITQQTIPQKGAMTPSLPSKEAKEAPYTFTDEDRKAASEKRWTKEYDWEETDIQEALGYLASIRAETERGGIILQRRVSELKVEKVKCYGCENIIDISQGRWATYRTRNNFETGLPESAYACSAACGLKLNREFSHPVRVPQPLEIR